MAFNKISVIGLGYIGLPTAAVLAQTGTHVVGVDIDKNAVDTINRGEIHIVEPKLKQLVLATVKSGHLKATTKPEASDAFLIAVPTPFEKNQGAIKNPDLEYIKAAAISLASVLKKGDLIILESTSPVGTTEQLATWLAQQRPDLKFPSQSKVCEPDINIAYCPERVLPGHIVRELVQNDRVIGGLTKNCSIRARELYNMFVKGECFVTNARTAEMTKLTENACRDVQIAFANELSLICSNLDIDVWELIALANRHPRIDILQPGPGVGGHCIAVDPWFIASSDQENSRLIQTARHINDSKPLWVIEKVKHLADQHPRRRIICLGLAFKPNIDDLRESPSLHICEELYKIYNERVCAVEPNTVQSFPFRTIPQNTIDYDQDIVVCLVSHNEFQRIKKPKLYVDCIGLFKDQ